MKEPKEWLVIQVKTTHHEGAGDDLWQEFHFYPHYTVKEWELFAQELAGSISDWLTLQRKRSEGADGRGE